MANEKHRALEYRMRPEHRIHGISHAMAALVDVVHAGRLSYADAEAIVASLAKLYDATTTPRAELRQPVWPDDAPPRERTSPRRPNGSLCITRAGSRSGPSAPKRGRNSTTQVSIAADAAPDRDACGEKRSARPVWQGSDHYRRKTRDQGRNEPTT